VLQLPCGADPGEAATENEDPRSLTAGDVSHDARPTLSRRPSGGSPRLAARGRSQASRNRSRPRRGEDHVPASNAKTEGANQPIEFASIRQPEAVNFW
jgi:hypothetical protein